MPQPNPLVDYGAALLMAWGVSTALYHRERSGAGQKLDIALLQAALVLQNNNLYHIDAVDGGRIEFVEYLKTAFAEGATWAEVLERRTAASAFALMRAYYGFHRTSDGTIAVGHEVPAGATNRSATSRWTIRTMSLGRGRSSSLKIIGAVML